MAFNSNFHSWAPWGTKVHNSLWGTSEDPTPTQLPIPVFSKLLTHAQILPMHNCCQVLSSGLTPATGTRMPPVLLRLHSSVWFTTSKGDFSLPQAYISYMFKNGITPGANIRHLAVISRVFLTCQLWNLSDASPETSLELISLSYLPPLTWL